MAGQEDARQRERQQRRDAFEQERQDRSRLQWQRDDQAYQEKQADKAAERQAMAPTEVKPDLAPDQMGPAAFQAAGQTFANPDQAAGAAKAYNAPAAGLRRASAAVRDPSRAAELQSQANQAEQGAINLGEAQHSAQRLQFRRDLVRSYINGGFAGGLQFMSDSHGDGRGGKLKFSAAPTPDGHLRVTMTGEDGKPVGSVGVFEDSVQGFNKLSTQLDLMTSPQQLHAHFQNLDKIKAEADQRKTDNEFKDRQLNETKRHNQAIEGIGMARVSGAAVRRDDDQPLWTDKAESSLHDMFTTKEPGLPSRVDGIGLQFGKHVALGQARLNGGNTALALGFVAQKDDELRAIAKTDVKLAAAEGKVLTLEQAHNQRRIQYLQHIGAATQPPAAPPTKADVEGQVRTMMAANGDQRADFNIAGHRGTAGAPPKRESVGRMSAAAAAAFKPDPKLEPALQAELLEMANGKRLKFSSPELAAYHRAKNEAERAAPYEPSQAQQSELARAQRLSREQLGAR